MNNYASLQEGAEQEETGVLFHVVEPSRARWNHIQDLDSFFSRMYKYHQRHGFVCMLWQEIAELAQFIFIVFFTLFLLYFVNYPILFRDKLLPNSTKVTISDVVYPVDQWSSQLSMWTVIMLIISALVWIIRLIRSGYTLIQFWDIKQFYNIALGYSDLDLANLTWHEIQTKVRAVQLEQQMCIHKAELTELDIYHRILRQDNYLVAMTNKRLIPPRMNIPFLGEVVYWTRSIKCNLQFLLFWGAWAPFENPWHLKEEFKKPTMRHELARNLQKQIAWLVLGNVCLMPIIFIWQMLHTFFSYAEMAKREPGNFGLRNWSSYGKMYLRHFNELDHEFNARLCRAHRPAIKYLGAFVSPLTTIIARFIAFICGSVLAVCVILTAYDPDVLSVEHLFTTITILGTLMAICHPLITDETNAWTPEFLLQNVLHHIHYFPSGWKNQAHTNRVRREFQQLFQYKFVSILEELLSPLLTPYLLWTYVRPRATDIVDFFRSFTVSVVGVGDVCSFAQMDVRRHGNPEWQEMDTHAPKDQYTQAEDGKTELSLIHFRFTNPQWVPPPESLLFVENFERETNSIHPINPGGDLIDSSMPGAVWKREGPLHSLPNDLNMSTMFLHERHHRQTTNRSVWGIPPVESTPLLGNR